jgi:signal transduction histidine kinase
VRQIIEAHGSLLDVKSTEGKGSVFKFPLLIIRD